MHRSIQGCEVFTYQSTLYRTGMALCLHECCVCGLRAPFLQAVGEGVLGI